ncbi:hypothetical protein AAC387_Pa11g1198 [Persea americana]
MDSDSDLLSLSLLAASIGIDRVNVLVSEFIEFDDEDKEDNGDYLDEDSLAKVDYEGTNMETDPLPQSCSHKEKILLLSEWANGIRHVGQRFEGGVAEFRNEVCKYLSFVDLGR